MDSGVPSSHWDLEVLAAQLRQRGSDLSLYAGFLLNVLSAALPAELVEVRHEGRWKARFAGREPAVLAVSVLLGDHRYELSRPEVGRPATALVRHESGGVVLSSRPATVDEWARGLAAGLARIAEHNAAAAAALQRLTTP
jgi:hypothetical protein